jgi:hypothetical protein
VLAASWVGNTVVASGTSGDRPALLVFDVKESRVGLELVLRRALTLDSAQMMVPDDAWTRDGRQVFAIGTPRQPTLERPLPPPHGDSWVLVSCSLIDGSCGYSSLHETTAGTQVGRVRNPSRPIASGTPPEAL